MTACGRKADIAAFDFGFPNVRLRNGTCRTSSFSRAARTQGDGEFMSTIAARR